MCDFISDHALIKCYVDLPRPVVQPGKKVSFRRHHHIDKNVFRSELNEIPFVKSPAGTVSELYEQYTHDLSAILDKHAPVITKSAVVKTVNWLSDSYRLAKSLRRQYEHAWRKTKNLLTRSRLRKQIAQCNKIANKDECNFYKNIIAVNKSNSRKLWNELRNTT